MPDEYGSRKNFDAHESIWKEAFFGLLENNEFSGSQASPRLMHKLSSEKWTETYKISFHSLWINNLRTCYPSIITGMINPWVRECQSVDRNSSLSNFSQFSLMLVFLLFSASAYNHFPWYLLYLLTIYLQLFYLFLISPAVCVKCILEVWG